MKSIVKKYLPFGIVVALFYLVMPIFFQGENYKYDAIEYQFVFPATALLSGLIYAWRNGMDFAFPLVPPIIYIASVLIYSHYYHWAIYVFIYLIVCMLGCFIDDMVYKGNQAEQRRRERARRRDEENFTIHISNITVEDSLNDFEAKDKNQ